MSTERVSLQLSLDDVVEYLTGVGTTLMSYGCSTHRTENVVRLIAEIEGCTAHAFALPTGFWLSVRRGDSNPVVRMTRVHEWALDLDRLSTVDRVFNDVIDRKITLREARSLIVAVEKQPPPYPPLLSWLASAAAAGASAVFFRARLPEVGIAALGGLLLYLASRLLRNRPEAKLLENFIGGLVAACLAWAATALNPQLSREVIVLSVVILLVPGMTLTTGLSELANRNLVAGGARLMQALMVFLSILIGIAGPIAVERALHLRLHHVVASAASRDAPAVWIQVVALLASAIAFSIVFAVPRRYLWAAVISGALGWIVTGQAAIYLPGSIAAFAAALIVSLYANACARATKRPTQVFLMPGMVLLVPGSFGFLSLESFLRGEFLGGAAKGFEMFMIAGSIVIGTLLANVVLPSRKVL
jgi:uncharacterized membrane protein YjjP (DUF1212 family)